MRLARSLPGMPAAAPVRIVHLGVGNFYRAHAAWYTHHAPDASDWGIAAFTGRRPDAAQALAPQDGLYSLITKAAEGDEIEVIASIVAVHRSDEHQRYLDYLSDPAIAILTLTVTEAGYRRGQDGHIDLSDEQVAADIAALRVDPRAPVQTVPGKLVAGLLARRAAGAGPISVLSCDNLPNNGAATEAVVLSMARAIDDSAADWAADQVDFATPMVDRITPATTDADRDAVAEHLDALDAAPVPTEPFSEWVISGTFPAGRPAWQDAGVQLVTDVEPHERRKLWLLNGSHSQLAYVGSILGHQTIDAAIADQRCLGWVRQWWEEAASHLNLPTEQIAAYTQALLRRYANPRVRHLTAQIAADGSQKIPVRTVPVVVAERAAGRIPIGGATTLAGWILHLRGHGAPIKDQTVERALAAAATEPLVSAVDQVLQLLGLGQDPELAAAVTGQAELLLAGSSA
ncbi:MAG: mannitol dehydrogenase family protein [Beutenbergiaceae bacterium]